MAATPVEATRTRLSTRRRAVADLLKIGGHTVHISIGTYPEGRPAEVFIDMHKQGAPLRMFGHAFAIVVSIGLQHGVPAHAFVQALAGIAGGPSGDVEGDDEGPEETRIKHATSIPDLVVRMLDRVAQGARR